MKNKVDILKLKEDLQDHFIILNGGWTSSKGLEAWFGVSGSSIRKAVHMLRTEGVPIVSGQKGYRLTSDVDEILNMAESLDRRASYIREASAGLKEYARNLVTFNDGGISK